MWTLLAPGASAGAQAADQISTLSKELEQEMAVVKKAIGSGAASPSEILADLSTITGALASMSADIKKTVEGLGSLDGAAELKDAFTGWRTNIAYGTADLTPGLPLSRVAGPRSGLTRGG